MSLTVPNLQSALVNIKGIVLQPWITFFQQFVQAPSSATVQSANASYTAKEPGTLSIVGGTGIQFQRGSTSVETMNDLLSVEIGDIVTWNGAATVTFFPRY